MLTEQTLDMIQKTAVRADGNRVVKVPNEPAHVYHLLEADGSLSRHVAESKPTAHAAYDVPTVAEFLAQQGNGAGSELWYSRAGVVAVVRTAGREDRCTLTTGPSAQLAALIDVANTGGGKEYAQGALWQHLRTTFAGCLDAHPNLRQQVGNVDIKKAQEASGTVERKGVSVSRKLVAEASGADQLPEVLTFSVPVFASAVLTPKARVRVAFDLDAQSERFRLTVLPGEIEAAHVEGESYLFKLITEEMGDRKLSVPVYYGRPS